MDPFWIVLIVLGVVLLLACIFSAVRWFQKQAALAVNSVPCPICASLRPVQTIRFPQVQFFYLAYVISSKVAIACAPCMRKQLRRHWLANLPVGIIFPPIILFNSFVYVIARVVSRVVDVKQAGVRASISDNMNATAAQRDLLHTCYSCNNSVVLNLDGTCPRCGVAQPTT